VTVNPHATAPLPPSSLARTLNGELVTAEHLPPAGLDVRWTPVRKLVALAALEHGTLSLDDARARWALSVEELAEWRRLFVAHGVSGLRATHLALHRPAQLVRSDANAA
jgi:Protein of unknown function (DUF1153)